MTKSKKDRHDRFNGEEETNVEGIAFEIVSSFPLEDPDASREIAKQIPEALELALKLRADRKKRQKK
jgi:phosphoribosylformimino-5-aminoimidazole carboxamide ribonucleotide (ProFAR) isomerase